MTLQLAWSIRLFSRLLVQYHCLDRVQGQFERIRPNWSRYQVPITLREAQSAGQLVTATPSSSTPDHLPPLVRRVMICSFDQCPPSHTP